MARIIRKPVRIVRRTTNPGLGARFWRRVRRCDSGCWIWTRARGKNGYGQIGALGGKSVLYAHRLSYELNIGPIPDGLFVLHSCDTPSCVNPGHLFLGTGADNSRDMARKGRCKPSNLRGEIHGSAKLTAAQVAEIRSSYASGGTTYTELGERFGIHYSTVGYIVQGKLWKDSERRRR